MLIILIHCSNISAKTAENIANSLAHEGFRCVYISDIKELESIISKSTMRSFRIFIISTEEDYKGTLAFSEEIKMELKLKKFNSSLISKDGDILYPQNQNHFEIDIAIGPNYLDQILSKVYSSITANSNNVEALANEITLENTRQRILAIRQILTEALALIAMNTNKQLTKELIESAIKRLENLEESILAKIA